MKLIKAKEIIDLNLKEAGKSMPPDVYQALALGSKALERCQHNYLNPQRADFRLLPGETED